MGKFTKFTLPLKSLPKGTHHFEFVPDKKFFEDMESCDIHDASLKCDVEVKYNGDIYDVTFLITGEVTVQCDRCLEEMPWPIDASYHIEVRYGDTFADDSDELIEIPSNMNELNVAYMIYDTVSLAIPIKHVHPLGKCNRQMTAMLRKHRVASKNDDDAELENDLMAGIDDDDAGGDEEGGSAPSDPRWAALQDFAAESGGEADEAEYED